MFGNFSIATKLYGFVTVFAVGLIVLLSVTFVVLGNNERALEEIGTTGRQALLVARMNTNVQAMSAAQFRMVANPTADVVKDSQARIQTETDLFRERLANVRASAHGVLASGLDPMEKQFENYRLVLAAVGKAASSSDRETLLSAATEADKVASSLREAARAIFKQAETEANAAAASAHEHALSGKWTIGATALIFMMLGMTFAHLIAHVSIIRPLHRAVKAIARLAQDDVTTAIEDAGRNDEIGEVARGLEIFRAGLAERRHLVADQTAAAAAREKRAAALEQAIAQFQQQLGTTVQAVATSAVGLRSSADSLDGSAGQGEELATSVAAAAEQAAGNVGSVAAAAEQLSGSIDEIARQIAASHAIVTDAAGSARRANSVIDELAQCSQKIGEVVGMIGAIASQTNLLALNATIEAARAGELGKGFAVVASEVKNLATQTAQATDQVTQQIGMVQAKTDEAVAAIRDVGDIIRRVGEMTTSVAGAVEEQSAATAEIARNVDQAAIGTSEVTRHIDGVRRAAATTGEEAGKVKEASGSLSVDAERLRTDVEVFLKTIQALERPV